MARTLEQIQKQIAQLQSQAQALKQKEVSGVIARIKEAIGYYELTPDDLFGGAAGKRAKAATATRQAVPKGGKSGPKTVRKPVAIKYRDANGNTWTGRGNQPRWLVSELAAGRKLEDFLIER